MTCCSRKVALFLGLVALAGCRANYVDRGAALCANRNYVEADELFEHTERRLEHASLTERARYGLYRGVALLSLGDDARAGHWLRDAERISRRHPAVLSDEERDTLTRALETHSRSVARNDATRRGDATFVTATAAQ